MFKKILKVIGLILMLVIKVALVIAIFGYSWYFLSPYFRTDRNKEGDLYRNLPPNSIDVICLGSSHMQYAFNPAGFYAETGYYSYVMGSPCQPMAMSYNMLVEVLKTQSPEVVFVDVFTLLPQSEVCYADGMYYKAIDEMTGENRLCAANEAPKKVRYNYMFDLLMNHDNWKYMKLENMDEIIKNAQPAEGYNYDLGYVRQEPKEFTYLPLYTYEVTEKVQLTDKEKQQLDNIINLCKENNITLYFIKTPFIIDQDNTNKLAAIWKYLDSKHIKYVDFIERAEELKWYINMDGDTWHNNSWGAEIITKELARITKQEHLVKNHKDNEVIQSLLKDALHISAYSLMNATNVDVYRLLDEASKYPSYVLVKYSGSWASSIGEEEQKLFNQIGLRHDFIEDKTQDYYAIVENGKLLKDSNEPFSYELMGWKLDLTEEGILINGAPYDNPGELELIFMAEDYSWINSIPIDYASRWFWKNGYDGFTPVEQ